MEKWILISVFFMLFAASCESHKDLYQPLQTDFENIAPFASYDVPVQPDKITIVTYGEDTLAITGVPMTIDVPKEALLTRSTTIKIDFVPATDNKYAGYRKEGMQWKSDFVLMFEDTRNGDHDYNDLIVTVHMNWDGSTTIYPIAYGAKKTIDLGVGTDREETYVVRDCRANLFKDQSGQYINTLKTDNPRPQMSVADLKSKAVNVKIPNGQGRMLYWFIETDGPEGRERMYTVLNDNATQKIDPSKLTDKKGWPYGIAFVGGSIDNMLKKYTGGPYYPTENTPIQEVYRNFEDWLTGAWRSALTNGGGKGVNNTNREVCYNISN